MVSQDYKAYQEFKVYQEMKEGMVSKDLQEIGEFLVSQLVLKKEMQETKE